jgi:hypothetical protein
LAKADVPASPPSGCSPTTVGFPSGNFVIQSTNIAPWLAEADLFASSPPGHSPTTVRFSIHFAASIYES